MTDVLIVVLVVVAVIVFSLLISAASRPKNIPQMAEAQAAEAELNERESEGRD